VKEGKINNRNKGSPFYFRNSVSRRTTTFWRETHSHKCVL